MKSACVGVLSIIELKNAQWNIEIRRVFKFYRWWFTLLLLGFEPLIQVPEKYVWLLHRTLFLCIINCRGTALFIEPLPKKPK